MLNIILFIQCTVFIASYVYCARQPPDGFFNEYDEKDCVKLDHVTSHIIYHEKNTQSLDMICRAYGWYHLASFASPEPTIKSVRISALNIIKMEHNFTLFNFRESFESSQKFALASLFFESLEDAKNFNRDVYSSWNGQLEHLQRIGRIDEIFTTQPNKYSIATNYADIYLENSSLPPKYVIEADGNPEPVLVFTRREFQMSIDESQKGNIEKIRLKLERKTAFYEIYFANADEGNRFADILGKFTRDGELLIQ